MSNTYHKFLHEELTKLTKEELIEFIDDYDSYIAEFISDNQGLRLIDDVIPDNIIGFYEQSYLNKEEF